MCIQHKVCLACVWSNRYYSPWENTKSLTCTFGRSRSLTMVSRLEKVFDRVIGILPPNIAEELSSRREVVIESLREGLDNVNLPPSPLTWRNGHGRVDRLPSPPNVGSSGE